MESALLLVDLQPRLLAGVERGPEVLRRAAFLSEAAGELGVPVFATVQNPDRLGPIDEALIAQPVAKMTFSAAGLFDLPKRVILSGVETHICVLLTARDLLSAGHEVIVCPDACGSSTFERHKLGMETLRDLGVLPMHTESVVYDWMGSAEHPAFRRILALVKASTLSV